MRHTTTENKHTIVLSENEWDGLETILSVYNEALSGAEFEDKNEQRAAKQLFKLFDMDCLIDDYPGDDD